MADEREGMNLLVSIVMPCCGQLEYTRLSVPRLIRHSRQPFELIFVDEGSLDGTTDYLAGVAAGATSRIEVCHSEHVGTLPQLLTRAFDSAKGRFVAWVNNDVLVPDCWLQHLLALITASEEIGVVGPMSNVAPQHQRITPIPYRLGRSQGQRSEPDAGGIGLDTSAVDRFAQDHRNANRGQWSYLDQFAGFCWLAKREVLDRVKLPELIREESAFDAQGLSGRVRQAGFRFACSRDLYVHHFGSHLVQ
jgi:GT2 family glycosyltransferase